MVIAESTTNVRVTESFPNPLRITVMLSGVTAVIVPEKKLWLAGCAALGTGSCEYAGPAAIMHMVSVSQQRVRHTVFRIV